MTGGHLPDQPAWTCGSCGKDWPCDPAREALAVEYRDDVVMLSIWMGAQLGLAVMEIRPRPTPQELYHRFIAWALALRVPMEVE